MFSEMGGVVDSLCEGKLLTNAFDNYLMCVR